MHCNHAMAAACPTNAAAPSLPDSQLQRLAKLANSPVAAGRHEGPLDLLWLDGCSQFKVRDGLLIDLTTHVKGPQPADDIQVDWPHSVSVLVVAQRLGFLIKPGKEKAEQQVGEALSTSDVTAPSTCEAGQSEKNPIIRLC